MNSYAEITILERERRRIFLFVQLFLYCSPHRACLACVHRGSCQTYGDILLDSLNTFPRKLSVASFLDIRCPTVECTWTKSIACASTAMIEQRGVSSVDFFCSPLYFTYVRTGTLLHDWTPAVLLLPHPSCWRDGTKRPHLEYSREIYYFSPPI